MKTTPLHDAARRRSTTMVQMLIEAGAYLNTKDRYHETALQLASRSGYTEVVQILIDAGAEQVDL